MQRLFKVSSRFVTEYSNNFPLTRPTQTVACGQNFLSRYGVMLPEESTELRRCLLTPFSGKAEINSKAVSKYCELFICGDLCYVIHYEFFLLKKCSKNNNILVCSAKSILYLFSWYSYIVIAHDAQKNTHVKLCICLFISTSVYWISFFDVFLTVHLSIILAINQHNEQILVL